MLGVKKRMKKLKKGVDKRGGFCYYKRALQAGPLKSLAAEAVEKLCKEKLGPALKIRFEKPEKSA